MWWDLVIDVIWPSRATSSLDRIVEKRSAGTLAVEFREAGAFKRRLNESGWLADEVIAAGVLRQGKAPSVLALVSGLALVELLRPRRSKALPREFALAVNSERVVAFGMSPWAEGDGTTDRVVRIKRAELGSWAREFVRIDLPKAESKDGTLEFAGLERFPVTLDRDQSTDELVELLSR